MRHAILVEARRPGAPPYLRNALILALGLAILTGLVLSDVTTDTVAPRQGFPDAGQSLSFMPETVRLRTPE